LVQKLALLDHVADLLPVVKGVGGGALVIGLGHLHRLVQGVLHLLVEPVLDRVGDEAGGDEEEQHGGDQRERDEGEHQFGAQPGAGGVLAPFQQKLGQVAEHQVDQEDDEQDDDVDDAEDGDVAPQRHLGIQARQVHLGEGEQQDGQQRQADDDRLALSLPDLGGRQAGARGLGAGRALFFTSWHQATLYERKMNIKQGRRAAGDKKEAPS